MKPLVIGVAGSGNHARVVIEAARLAGFTDIKVLLPPELDVSAIRDTQIAGGYDRLDDKAFLRECQFVPGGLPAMRREMAERALAHGCELATIIHPRAFISPSASVGMGSVVLAGAVVSTNASTGRCCLINTLASVDHDGRLDDYVTICPGAHLAGTVVCEDEAFIGIGASVIQGIIIGKRAVVGAGAVVIRDVPPDVTMVGNPARQTR